MTKTVTAFDTETHLISKEAIFPKIICASFCDGEHDWIVGNDDMDALKSHIEAALRGYVVGHNLAFDLCVVANNWPDLLPLIFDMLDKGRGHDTKIRERLHSLGTHGHCDYKELPDGTQVPIKYSLAALEKVYLGIDRDEDKQGDDIWRLNYSTLDGVPAGKYPDKAREYALDDAINTYRIFRAQESHENLSVEAMQVRTDFCLALITMAGFKMDPVAVKQVTEEVEEEMADSNQTVLIEAGVLRPSQPSRPHKRGTGWTKPKKASVNRKVLLAKVEEVSEAHGIALSKTDSGNTSADAEVIEELALFDKTLEAYQSRQYIAKLSSTYIPKMYWEGEIADRVFFNYNVIVDTSRTSSFGSKLYPSANGQQVDPRVRKCYVADDGYVLIASDYSSLELCSLAWKLKGLFGQSKLHDLLESGRDPHCYLGSVLAYNLDAKFRDATEGLDKDQIYEVFVAMKTSDKEEVRAFFKNYRTFAKPVGLGFPGGLGAQTFVGVAKATYGVNIREVAEAMDELPEVEVARGVPKTPANILATYLKELWFEAYPEMHQYFDWVTSIPDGDGYLVESPLGMVKRRASYCSAANGAGLQIPSAEGFKEAIWRVVRACWDETQGDLLYGAIPLNVIHDEIIIEVLDDSQRVAKADRLCQIMEEAMESVLAGIITRAEPCMMYRWKKADGEFNDKGILIPLEEAV